MISTHPVPSFFATAAAEEARSSAHRCCVCVGAAIFSREITGTDGYIEVLMYHVDNRKYVGMWSNDPASKVRDASERFAGNQHAVLSWP